MSVKQPPVKLTRRDVLKLSGTLAAGGLLASCTPTTPPRGPTDTPTASPTEVATETPTAIPTEVPSDPVQEEITVMHFRHEMGEDHKAQFEAEHPNITIEYVPADLTRLFNMFAAGAPPDLFRVLAYSVPQYLARGLLYDLTSYFETSEVLNLDDLAPANDYFRASGPLEVGDGPVWGMCMDWSPEFTLYVNTEIFSNAGLEVPDDTEPLTYHQVYDLARQLARFDGRQTAVFGFDYEVSWIEHLMMNMLAEIDMTLYSDSYNRLDLASNEQIREVARYFYDLAKNRFSVSPTNPSRSWIGGDFNDGIVAMLQYGYWFSAMAEIGVMAGKVRMLPAPTWAGIRRNPAVIARGMVMAADTKASDAAWKLFEWFNGLEPATTRAGSGWGVPALRSLYNLMPRRTDFQQQVQGVLQGEIALATPPVQFSPFLFDTIFYQRWLIHLDRALQGELTFDGMLEAVESEVNDAILSNIDRIL